MGATSWQHIRPFRGNIERTLEQVRQDVFAAGAFYLSDEPALIGAQGPEALATCASRPLTIADALVRNGDEGTHSVLDITGGVVDRPTVGAASPLARELAARCFGSVRPTLFDVLMSDFDAVDVCDPGTSRYFVIAESGEPTLVVFVGCTGA